MNMEAIAKAIADGDVIAYPEAKIKIDAKTLKAQGLVSPDGLDKDAFKSYTGYEAQNARGMVALVGKIEPKKTKPAEGDDTRTDVEKESGACDYFNYGLDLELRAKVRAQLLSELEGPEKAITKGVKSLVENAGMSESEARELVIKQRKANNLPV